MKQQINYRALLFTIICLMVFGLSVQIASSAPRKKKTRSSIGFVGGIGQPIGWWGERWNTPLVSEINFRHEFSRGSGVLLFVGVSNAEFTELSDSEIESESNLGVVRSEFEPFTTIPTADQSGSFKETPIGIGFYFERMVTKRRLRGYGTAALVVHIWKVERTQNLTRVEEVEDFEEITSYDNWATTDDGSDLGAQLGCGITYQMRKYLYIDTSIVYNFSNIGKHNGAVLYWGLPSRTRTGGVYDESEGSTDLVQLRLGFRFGS